MKLDNRIGIWLRLCLCIALAMVVVSAPSLVVAKSTGQYIVLLEEPPVALYEGGVAGYEPASPAATGAQKLDRNSRAAKAYADHLSLLQEAVLSALQSRTRTPVKPSHRYVLTLNGFAAPLTPEQVETAAAMPGVAAVMPDAWRYPLTDVGPEWIKADTIWNGVGQDGIPFKGEGMVVGIIDSGINTESPSFADMGGDGYNHDNPRGRYYGVCDPSSDVYDPQYTCNDKLIGMWSFVRTVPNADSPLDTNGHGSHVASTAAGNVVEAVIHGHTATLSRPISGVAPHANIITYRGLEPQGGLTSWLVACIEQAVADQVDVINYSIGGGRNSPWTEPDDMAFLAARAAGVFVAAAVGNDGPESATVSSPSLSPWLISVGNVTHSRVVRNTLEHMAGGSQPPADIHGMSMTGSYGPAPIVYAGDYANPNETLGDTGLCGGPFPEGTFNGEIVVCDRGIIARVDKGKNVLAGGAGGLILANQEAAGDSLNADDHYLPAVHITYEDGVTLKHWLASEEGHLASISGMNVVEEAAFGDIMAASSSRGPSSVIPGILIPDVCAPGSNVLAAGQEGTDAFEFMSGTSMASPHVAGAAALLAGLHKDWTPAELQSTLMTTAVQSVRKEDRTTPADPFDMGAGRIDVARADRAGLILDIPIIDYVRANPLTGGAPDSLNLPSLAVGEFIETKWWSRTVTGNMDTTEDWSVAWESPENMELTVSPQSFSLARGQKQELFIELRAGADAGSEEWGFGSLTLTPSSSDVPSVHIPLAAFRDVLIGPDTVQFLSATPSDMGRIENLSAVEIDTFTADMHGFVPGTMHHTSLVQDPTGEIDLSEGEWIFPVSVPEGTQRLVAAITETTAPDLDMSLIYDGAIIATSAGGASAEYVQLQRPQAGTYYVLVMNYNASDPTGATGDDVSAVIGVVPQEDAGNAHASVAGNGHIPAEQSFDVRLDWDVDAASPFWFGAVSLGTSPAKRGNLGLIGVDMLVTPSGAPNWLQEIIDAGDTAP